MRNYRYLIIGGGMTGHAAATAIREIERDAPLAMLSAEPDRPYARPPLSKGLWLGKEESSAYLPEVEGLEIVLGRRAVALDTWSREVRDDAGETYRYEKLLLATGGRPRRLPSASERIIYLRTLADFRRLRDLPGRRVAVIGAGFIGSEIAAALAQTGKEVSMIFPDAAIGAHVYPADLAAYVTRTFEEKGVRLFARRSVTAVEDRGGETLIRLSGGGELAADVVVAGLGIEPDTALAEQAGIRCANGITVDGELRTSAPDVWAAGDVACFFNSALGGQVRVEHEDNALVQGRTAGRAMAGAAERYTHLPFFYSDMFDLGYEAIGRLDVRLETIASWKRQFREGAIYYLERGEVRGVLLWGIFGRVDAARALIEGRRETPAEELARAIP